MLTFLYSYAPLLMTLLFQDDDGGAAAAAGGAVGSLCGLGIAVLVIAGLWKVFTKAGKPGWAAIVPIYNYYVLTQIIGRPAWWIILLFIPFVNFIVLIVMMNDLSKSFGKGMGFTIGLILLSPIFILLLGFGDAQYMGPAAAGGGSMM